MNSDHICTEKVNFRDWVLGQGEFAPEKVHQAYRELGAKLGRIAAQRMIESLDAAFANLDAAPAATADSRPLGNPVASAVTGTGDTQEPVAWAVRKKNPPVGESPVLCWWESEMRSVEKSLPGCTVIPLHAEPQPALTDEERFVLREVRDIYADEDDVKCNEIAAVLAGLLERLGLERQGSGAANDER